MNAATLPTLWATCVEHLKDRVNNRSFWEAIEQTVPVTLEDNILIIGMDPLNFNRATYIQQTSTLHTVNQTVSEQFGKPIEVRLIEGTSLEEWNALKAREAHVAALKQQQNEALLATPSTPSAPAAPRTATALSGWESLYESVSRLSSQMPLRSLPQGKARYANEALYTVVEALDTLYPDDADELTERQLGRVLDRIASSSEIPAPVLAFELERLRAWRRSGG